METKANYVAVGVFVIVLLFGLAITLLWLGGSQYTEEYAYYRTYFSGSVTGLGDGTLVRYNGIQVGRVSKVDFDPNDPKRVIVTLQINPDLPIHTDSVATIASEGLTGGTYVEIDGGSQTSPVLPHVLFGEYPVIKSKPSTLQEIEQSAPQLLARINGIADRLSDVLSPQNRQAFAQTMTNLRDVTGVLAKDSTDFDATLKNLKTASVGLNTDLSDLHTVLLSANNTTHRLDRLSDDVDKLSSNVGKLSDDLDTQVNGARFDQLMGETRDLLRSVTHLSNELDREPTKLIFGDRRKGYTPQ
ncbi:MAG TPA: MlaD family protein [Rhizomicrobium sp.]|jgi:phospholipid/cholesterol/gamma-HCH transport system substrate-binding protein|nr:MlaD family protein [Rhizomicrobium sp.]